MVVGVLIIRSPVAHVVLLRNPPASNHYGVKLLLSSPVKGAGTSVLGLPRAASKEPSLSWGQHGGVEIAWTWEPDRSAASLL